MTDVSHTETNPLGMQLPQWIEKRVNRVARRVLPKAYAKIDANTGLNREQTRQGIEIEL